MIYMMVRPFYNQLFSFSKTRKDGITYRGCTGELDQSIRISCTDDTVCRICNGTNCNGGVGSI